MEHRLDIFKIIRHYGQDINVVAKVLYPNVRYPRLALDRIKKGEADLSLSQLYRLADFLGLFITDLFDFDTWKGSSLDNDAITFTKGEYTAFIRPNGMVSMRKGSEVVYTGVMTPAITIDELLTTLNNVTDNGNNQSKC